MRNQIALLFVVHSSNLAISFIKVSLLVVNKDWGPRKILFWQLIMLDEPKLAYPQHNHIQRTPTDRRPTQKKQDDKTERLLVVCRGNAWQTTTRVENSLNRILSWLLCYVGTTKDAQYSQTNEEIICLSWMLMSFKSVPSCLTWPLSWPLNDFLQRSQPIYRHKNVIRFIDKVPYFPFIF